MAEVTGRMDNRGLPVPSGILGIERVGVKCTCQM